MPYKGYADKEKRKEYLKGFMREYRAKKNEELNKKENRLGYLESEVTRLQKCLEVAQRGSAMP